MAGDILTIALSKGNLLKATTEMFSTVGLPVQGVDEDSRNMVFSFAEPAVKYIMCRPTDVPTYVEQGAADLGIVGKEVIEFQSRVDL